MKYTVKRGEVETVSVVYDDITYCVCASEEHAVVICAALNSCQPAVMHARGVWLEARTCAQCGARTDFNPCDCVQSEVDDGCLS